MGGGARSGNAGFVLICLAAACDKLGEYPARSDRREIVHSPAPCLLLVGLHKDRRYLYSSLKH